MEFVNYGSWVLWVVGFGGSCNGGFWSMVWWIVVVSWFGVVVSYDSGVKFVRSLLCMVMSLDWELPTQTKRIKLCNVTMNEESQYL